MVRKLFAAMLIFKILTKGEARLLSQTLQSEWLKRTWLSRSKLPSHYVCSLASRLEVLEKTNDNSDKTRYGSTEQRTRIPSVWMSYGSERSTSSSVYYPWRQQKRLLHRWSESTKYTTQRLRTIHFWLRGGTEEEEIATRDLSGKRPYVNNLLGSYPISVCSVQGFRDYMEDEFATDIDFAAVFDGHGGKAVSRYLRQNLYANIQAALPMILKSRPNFNSLEEGENFRTGIPAANCLRHNNDEAHYSLKEDETQLDKEPLPHVPSNGSPTVEDYEAAMEVALDKIDREVLRIGHWSYQGSTSVACWIHQDNEIPQDPPEDVGVTTTLQYVTPRRTLITANVGDSRAVMSRNGTAIELTRDHKPCDPVELKRIYQFGGKVLWDGEVDRHGDPIPGTGIYRVNGNLALSRAIGDRSERPAVSAEPEFSVLPLTIDDEFVVIATDGLWDVMSSSDTVAFIHALLESDDTVDKSTIAGLLVEEALRRGTYDNVTVLIIWLNARTGPKGPKKWWI